MKPPFRAGRLAPALLLSLVTICHASTAWVTVCCNNPGPISLYDLIAGRALPDINTGAANPNDAVFSPDGKSIYVANEGPYEFGPEAGQITFIDTATRSITKTVSVANAPYSLAVSTDGSRLFVIGQVSDGELGNFTVYSVDTVTGKILATSAEYFGGGIPYGQVLLSPDGTTVYLLTSGYIYKLDAGTLQKEMDIAIDFGPLRGAISPDGSTIFIPIAGKDGVEVAALGTDTLSVEWSLPISSSREPGLLALNPTGTTLYATTRSSPPTLVSVSTAEKRVVASVETPAGPIDLVVTSQGAQDQAYAILNDGTLVSLSIATGAMTRLQSLPGSAGYLSHNGFNHLIVVADPGTDEVQGLDLETGKTLGTVLLGVSLGQGNALQVSPNGTYGLSLESNGVSAPNFQAGQNVRRVTVRSLVAGVAGPGADGVYALASASGSSNSQLYLVDLKTGYAASKLTLPFYGGRASMAISPDGKTLYIAPSASNILVIDTTSFQQTGTIPITASALATLPGSPSLLYLAVGNSESPSLQVWNQETQSVVASVSLPNPNDNYFQLILTGDGARAYLLNLSELVCVNVEQGMLTWSLPVGGLALSLAVTPDSRFVAVTKEFSSDLIIFDGATGAQVADYALDGPGGAVAAVE